MTDVYRLTANAKTMTWKEWKKIGGCGLSGWAAHYLKVVLGPMAKIEKDNPPLGDIARYSILAEREIARYGKCNLGIDDWAYLEYENGKKVAFDVNGGICDRSECGDYSSGPCDNSDCSARIAV